MKTLNVMLSNLGGRVVPIGYEGENLYTRIRINCIEVFSEYPDATVSMVVSPPDGEMYPAVVEKSGVMVVWDITDSVLSSNGSGECQLTFTEGDVVRKSVVFGISINRSLIANGEAPEPVQEWIDKAEQTARQIAEESAIYAKEEIVESYGEIAPAIIETASGAIASFSDGADGMLVKTLEVQIDPVQEGSGDPSPENVRPISGWDSANVSRTGKNLLSNSVSSGTTMGVTFTVNPDRSVTVATDGTATGRANLFYSGELHLPPSNYYLSIGKAFAIGQCYFELQIYRAATKTNVYGNTNGTSGLAFTLNEGDYIKQLYFSVFSGKAVNDTIYPQIEVGSTASTYEPYHGSTAEYEFPQEAGTVYGGTLTIHQDGSGELVVDRKYATFNGTNIYIDGKYSDGNFYSNQISDIISATQDMRNLALVICDRLKSVPNNVYDASTMCISQNVGKRILVKIGGDITTVEAANTYVNGMPVVYYLATPVTYQLTNQQVLSLLKGNNVCFADCGAVSLEYPADTKLYIDGKIAEIQALILENISNS